LPSGLEFGVPGDESVTRVLSDIHLAMLAITCGSWIDVAV